MKDLCQTGLDPDFGMVSDGLTRDEVARLRALLSVLRIGADGSSIELRTARARIALAADGTVRIEGQAIVQLADETITLDAATINLN